MKPHVNLFHSVLKTVVVALVLSVASATCAAREIQQWTFSELVEAADVIVIGTVDAIEDAPGVELDADEIHIPVRCRIRVDAVTKGEVSDEVLTVRLIRYMTYGEYLDAGGEEIHIASIPIGTDRESPVPVINAFPLAYDSLRDALNQQEQEEAEQPFHRESHRFILFLKAGADGDYEPVTEQSDSVDSVFRLDKADP